MTDDDYDKLRGGNASHLPAEVALMRKQAAARQHLFEGATDLFDDLNGCTFTAEQVCIGAKISGDILTNYLRKQGLNLFSPATGQGRARRFCLADVYTTATVAALADLSGKTRYCTASVWRHFALDPILQQMGMGEHNDADLPEGFEAQADSYINDVIASARNGVPAFFWRDPAKPFLFLLRSTTTYSGEFVSFFQQDLDGDLLKQFGSGIFINLTALFTEVDKRLEPTCWG
ncbi:hypothetical protein ACT6QH_00720 [Xanthobacter sp. TB0139]|uniref:hypothetical protein n=1 Tax=Xanthobacter sp. TB0139 TaxID=3459178 RepID=UPI004039A6F5